MFRIASVLFILILQSLTLYAEEENNFAFERFNFTLENDLFDQSDKGYTNGTKISAIYNVNTDVYSFFKIPFLYDSTKNHFTTISFGQDILTPEDTNDTIPNPNDEPYSGWLYMGMTWQQADSNNADTLELQLGVVGPAALGEEVQNSFHKLIGNDTIKGWDHQLKNEPGVILSYEHRWRYISDSFWGGLTTEAIPFAGAGLGNILTYADGGTLVRFGWNVPQDFGKSVSHPGQVAGLPAFDKGVKRLNSKFSLYIFTVVDVGFIPRNIFLDGNTFQDSPSVAERDYLVGELTAGLGIDIYKVHLAFINTHKTQDFALDKTGFDFGTILISYVY